MPRMIIVHYEEDPVAISNFKSNVTSLWNDHINFTKDAIVSTFNGGTDLPAITARLVKNQEDIAHVLTPYYGMTVSSTMLSLLKTHVEIVGKIIAAAKAGTDLTTLKAQWQANSQQIATYLHQLDSTNWPVASTVAAMDAHMKATLDEISAKVAQDPAGFISAYDSNHAVINKLADYYSGGIVSKFPDHFVITTPAPAMVQAAPAKM